MRHLIHLLRDLLRISRSPLDRLNLLRSYIGLLSPAGGAVRILDFDVHYNDAPSLRLLFRDLFVGRLYDVELSRSDPTIVDCGSNIGMSILFFKSRYPNARITGFEPHPETFATLKKNVDENRLDDVDVHPVAVSGCSEEVRLYFNDSDQDTRSLNMSMASRGHENHVIVEAKRLSDLMPEHVDLLKLDVEGAEGPVLAELAQRGVLSRVDHIVCEYHHHISGEDELGPLLSLLEAAGFGYQIHGYVDRPVALGAYQDLMLYAYRKDAAR